MKYSVKRPQAVNASIQLPASKSISNRALIINELAYSNFSIENLSDSDDTNVLLRALQSNDTCFDIGAAGTAMRFLTAYLSKIVGEWTITGSERMKQRPIRILVEALNSLGAKIEYAEKEGFPPLKILGSALQGGKIKLDGSVSSQYISALLMLAPTMEKGLTIELTGNVISKPYISLTLQLMADFGVQASWRENRIDVLPQTYIPKKIVVESDWSAASYWYEIAALAGNSTIELKGLYAKSYQGDAMIKHIFKNLGVKTIFLKNGNVRLERSKIKCKKLEYDFTDQPDLAQTLVVTCAMLDMPFRFSGLQSLKIKETDRIEALKKELKKLGYIIKDENDSILSWDGEKCEPETEPVIATYEDHRMAMAFAPVALKKEKVSINHPEVVTKSYPNFWQDLTSAGFQIDQSE